MTGESLQPTAITDIPVNGISLHVASWGEPAPPERSVLLVHGITANWVSMAPLGAALAERGWHAVAFDLRGRGLSAKPLHGYGVPYHANDLLSLLDALGLPRAHVVGHSLGGVIGLYLGALHPARLFSVTSIDAGGRVGEEALAAVAVTVRRVGQIYPSMDAFLDERRQASIYDWNDYWEEYYRYDVEERPDGSASSRMPLHALQEEVTVNALINTLVLPERVGVPLLVARAAHGTFAPDRGFVLPPDEAERIRTVAPNARVVEIPECNHYTIALSSSLTEEVVAFLSAHQSPGV